MHETQGTVSKSLFRGLCAVANPPTLAAARCGLTQRGRVWRSMQKVGAAPRGGKRVLCLPSVTHGDPIITCSFANQIILWLELSRGSVMVWWRSSSRGWTSRRRDGLVKGARLQQAKKVEFGGVGPLDSGWQFCRIFVEHVCVVGRAGRETEPLKWLTL